MEAVSIAPERKADSGDGAPQHLQALEMANRVRLARADLKRRVARGELDASQVVSETPWEADTMSLAELLSSQRRWGRTRVRRFLGQLALAENKPVGTLTHRQRMMLANELRAKVAC